MTLRHVWRGVALSALVALAVAPSALGHAEVQKRSPAPGSAASSGPKTVSIAFTQQIRSGGSLTVKRGSKTVIRGHNDPRNVKRIVGRTSKRLTTGVYKVRWSATYLDGHKESGSWSFRVR